MTKVIEEPMAVLPVPGCTDPNWCNISMEDFEIAEAEFRQRGWLTGDGILAVNYTVRGAEK